jgi:hypothetical protein
VKLRLAALVVAIAALAALYLFLLRDQTRGGRVSSPRPSAVIGTGSSAVGVAADGTILSWLPPPKEGTLPALPLSKPPAGGRLRGKVKEEALVLGAAPAALRPYVKSSSSGESGVDVLLNTGVELRFGDASQAARKWRAAAAVLASPSVTALDYVDLNAPGRPAIGGSGHALPNVP